MTLDEIVVSLKASTKKRRTAGGFDIENCHESLLLLKGVVFAPSLNFNLYPLGVVG